MARYKWARDSWNIVKGGKVVCLACGNDDFDKEPYAGKQPKLRASLITLRCKNCGVPKHLLENMVECA